ncbi:MAG: DUF1015 domain-containing protein [Deltaproteobacteria bacterium]|nr:DUF1015 domain-containing protein [Candidatus Anaeroferrophillacea bacterium]
MPIIKPFAGTCYNPERVADLAAVVAPPYDVIKETVQAALRARDPHNVIRLILGKSVQEKDVERPEADYVNAADTLAVWKRENILVTDPEPALYYLEEEFTALGTHYCRTGFIGLLQLDRLPASAVLPHEQTLDGPKADRLRLMQHTRANFSQIFTLYDDPEMVVDETLGAHRTTAAPAMVLPDVDGVARRLWRVTDADAIARVREVLAPQPLFIADGHHRFETALRYRELQLAAGNDDPDAPFQHLMVYCSNMAGPGLAVLPTHRLVSGYNRLTADEFRTRLGDRFTITEVPLAGDPPDAGANQLAARLAAAGAGCHFAVMLEQPPRGLLLTLTPAGAARLAGLHPALASLDVTVLHRLLLEEALEISVQDTATQRYISYVQDPVDAFAAVADGRADLAVLLRPTSVYQVKEVAAAGEKMPQKSTFFYPKLLTGLVLYLFDPAQ